MYFSSQKLNPTMLLASRSVLLLRHERRRLCVASSIKRAQRAGGSVSSLAQGAEDYEGSNGIASLVVMALGLGLAAERICRPNSEDGDAEKSENVAAASCCRLLATQVQSLGRTPRAQCDAPSTWQPALSLQKATTAESEAPRNVMLHRMRSLRARNLSEKYNVDWANVLGEGAYGSVYPARLAATGEKVALKMISKRYTNSTSFQTETDALLRIYDNGGHPNISGLRDMYEDFDHFYLVMDLVSGGEMFDHLINYGAYSEADAARLMLEVASALAFLHGVGVVHADLKPENLLLCSKKKTDGTIKIIDFGCSIVTADPTEDEDAVYNNEDADYETLSAAAGAGTQKQDTLHKSIIQDGGDINSVPSTGTTAYWPPERFERNSRPNPATDMWAVGIILYIMLTGAHPFDVKGISTDEEIEEQIRTDPSPPMTPQLTSHLSPAAIDLIKKLMAKDPMERYTADDMLQHPWIKGDEATTKKIEKSAQKLSKFKDLRAKIEAGIFAVLVDHGNRETALSEYTPNMVYKDDIRSKKGRDKTDGNVENGENTDSGFFQQHAPLSNVMKRAFEVFDAEGKGFVSADDLGRVVNEVTGEVLSDADKKDMLAASRAEDALPTSESGLSLSDFSSLFAGLKHNHFPKGHTIFNAGDRGDAMYFILSGKVEIQTRKGQLIHILRHGDFFGEGSLLEDHKTRFSTALCATPVDVIKIKRDDFERYIASSAETRNTLKFKWKARTLADAKNLIRLQTNVKARSLKRGDVVYTEGDTGTSMYFVDEKDGGVFEVRHGNQPVHHYRGGESFGESSLLFERPRSSTVICSSEKCKIHEMVGSDFLAFLETSPDTAESLRNMSRKRLFKKAIKAHSLGNKRGLTNSDLMKTFQEVDTDGSGTLSLAEITALMHRMDPTIPESEIIQLMKYIDLDEDGTVGFKEFKRLFRQFEYAANN